MKAASDLLLRISGLRNLRGHGESHFTMSVEEIRMILTASEKDGMLDPEESEMIRGVFELDEQTVRDAMIPRTQIRALSQNETLANALRFFRDIPHARFPVYDENLDRITGVVAIKEMLTVMAERSTADKLKDFKRTRQQMAIVIDEYGGTEGTITPFRCEDTAVGADGVIRLTDSSSAPDSVAPDTTGSKNRV